MRAPGFLLLGTTAMLGLAAVSGQPEFILPALLFAGGSALARHKSNQQRLAASLAEVEKRLSVTEGELEAASTELDQLKVEREFDRQLLKPPTAPPGQKNLGG
jgi:hypothetical protein